MKEKKISLHSNVFVRLLIESKRDFVLDIICTYITHTFTYNIINHIIVLRKTQIHWINGTHKKAKYSLVKQIKHFRAKPDKAQKQISMTYSSDNNRNDKKGNSVTSINQQQIKSKKKEKEKRQHLFITKLFNKYRWKNISYCLSKQQQENESNK